MLKAYIETYLQNSTRFPSRYRAYKNPAIQTNIIIYYNLFKFNMQH